jgi:hypothetical protein
LTLAGKVLASHPASWLAHDSDHLLHDDVAPPAGLEGRASTPQAIMVRSCSTGVD